MHFEGGVSVGGDPVHVATAHCTPATWSWHAPAPLQAPVLPHVVLVGQRPCGSVVSFGMLAQVPALTPTLHDLQVPQELAPQQTPSVQKSPVKQSVVAVQACPRRFFVPQS